MKISLEWLRDYVTWEGSAEELAERLTINGLNVESIETFELAFPGVVVGKVLECGRHPDADKLSLCQVEDGEGVKQVVCGAPNVRTGLTVLFARIGAKLPNGMKLKKSKIRGVESQGMICSASELGLSDESSGIMELEDGPEPGTPADDLYGYRDMVLDVEVTPNRPDWLSHIGVAREVAAITGEKLRLPDTWSPPTGGGRLDFTVEIEDFADCPRYTAHVSRGMSVGEAPRWMRNRLMAVGARPINNVVDITNYVLFETGQSLHAFDMKRLSGGRLIVRRATEGETLVTLDDESRTLTTDDLVIADGSAAVGLAGVMGGADTEVSDGTTDVLLESAFFEPSIIRRVSRRHQLISEASYRFERQADWEAVEFGARRALFLFQAHAGAHMDAGYIDRQDPDRRETTSLTLRVAQVNRLLGTRITTLAAVEYLQALGLPCQPVGQVRDRADTSGKLSVEVPSFRRDLHEEVDLIEEIARIYGYDSIEAAPHFRGRAGVMERRRDRAVSAIRRFLSDVGYSEIVTSTFVARGDLDRLGLPEDDPRHELLAVDNPHHGGETLLRSTLVPSLLATARHNLNADRTPPFRLFQIGTAFLTGKTGHYPTDHPESDLLPRETSTLQLAVVGRTDTVYGDVPADVMEVKGAVEALAEQLRVTLRLEPGCDEAYLQSGLCWRILDGEGADVGVAGAVGRRVLRAFEIDVPVALVELDLLDLDLQPAPIRYGAFSRFPAVKRDLSLVTPANVGYGDVHAVVRASGGPLLDSVELFDLFRGGSLEAGNAALGIRLKFQSAKGNLKGKAVDKAIEAIMGALRTELDVHLRG